MKRSLVGVLLTSVAIIFVMLAGCTSTKPEKVVKVNTARVSAQERPSYNTSIAWNDRIYGLVNETIPTRNIGKEVGRTVRNISPRPERNGDVACRYADGRLVVPDGAKLCLIKGISKNEAIAAEISDGRFLKAIKVGMLEKKPE
ncbi:MAG: hypothetical protein ACYC56_04665 [Candidatus Aquicultor sp.]